MPNHQEIYAAFVEQYPGIKPHGIYCQLTGKMVGMWDGDELIELAESLAGDVDEIADDLATRIFASMRPSLRWNKMRLESLDQLRKSHPVETLAYLMNRLTNSPNYHGDTLAINHDRIKLYNHLVTLELETVNSLLYTLIEVDSRLNLNKLQPPFSVANMIDRTESELLVAFERWAEEQAKVWQRLEIQREQETRWFRDGNTLAKRAAVSQFWESKPKSEKQLVEDAKRQDRAFMANILATLLHTEDTPVVDEVEPSTPRVKLPSTKMPRSFGLKKVGA